MSFDLILGPMYSGKSTELLRRIRRNKVIKKNTLVINNHLDDRYGPADEINTHHSDSVGGDNVFAVKSFRIFLEEHMDVFESADTIIIEELQFFDSGDAVEFIEYATDEEKNVVGAGLSGDSNKRPFDTISNCIPLADNIIHLKALCAVCLNGTPAPFTKEQGTKDTQIKIGGIEDYKAVCRLHHHSFR